MKPRNLSEARSEFERVSIKHKDLGASDTEPRAVFEELLENALAGGRDANAAVTVPTTPERWQLFTAMADEGYGDALNTAARELAAAAQDAIDLLS